MTLGNVLFYRNFELTQGTDEWLAWRRRVLGASDAPTIMSENPWKSRQYLLDEKLGKRPEFKGNALTREGHALEEVARGLLAKEFNITLAPAIVQSPNHAFLAASLDAIDTKNRLIFEIKCGAKSYEHVRLHSDLPAYYYGQVQHQLMVTQLEHMFFSAYRPDKKVITLQVPRNDAYISRLEKASLEFAKVLRQNGHTLQSTFVGTSVF